MSHEENEEVRLIAALWLERFGEPPAMLTDAELMWRVLRSVSEDPAAPRPATGRFNYL
jgi:hypothetical protein